MNEPAATNIDLVHILTLLEAVNALHRQKTTGEGGKYLDSNALLNYAVTETSELMEKMRELGVDCAMTRKTKGGLDASLDGVLAGLIPAVLENKGTGKLGLTAFGHLLLLTLPLLRQASPTAVEIHALYERIPE